MLLTSLINSVGLNVYVGADIAKKSLEDFVARITDASDIRGRVHKLIWADLGAADLTADACELWDDASKQWSRKVPLRHEELFDVVKSVQHDMIV